MKAAVFHQPGQPLSIQDIPTPTISSREMLVKVCLLYTSDAADD